VTQEDLLARLVVEARQDLQRRRALVGQDQFERTVALYTPKDFAGALRGPRLAVIAEMKQRTPTMGVLAEDYHPTDIAHAYSDGGAAAISVLTHMAGFGGRPDHIRMVRAATSLPILRKDFVTDPYEVAEARACGADAVLLIVAALSDSELSALHEQARALGMDVLVEVHDRDELDRALAVGAELIGVNNRDLRDFSVDLQRTMHLRGAIPDGVVVVSESGIGSAEQLRELERERVDAVLIGESLMRAAEPELALRALLGERVAGRSGSA